ncbi:hypothetical protein [Amycolatopsis sp. Hca4]|uniref:hypothetical protein n=1 Tax=Amycolatopsis sp. Hca4 TaxID=2742131 RepID=UPI0015915651|nr:hypothetical protein [Amycolatopsis sp. Hca4]QKV79747.1 hypothetical protein HUT10_42580 [Amycolatopsis sp. Hca4]
MIQLSREMVSVENGRIVFGQAVSQLAESLNPLGAAAKAVAEVSACITEMGRLKVESKRIDADSGERLTALADRRAAVGAALQEMRNSGALAGVSARGLLECIAKEQQHLVQAKSFDQQQLHANLVEVLGKLLVSETASGRTGLGDHIDKVLNGSGAPDLGRARNRRPQGTGKGRRK